MRIPDILLNDGRIALIVFSPDGHLLASRTQDSRPCSPFPTVITCCWIGHRSCMGSSVRDRDFNVPLRGHEDTNLCMTFSPDGSRIVSGSMDRTFRLECIIGGPNSFNSAESQATDFGGRFLSRRNTGCIWLQWIIHPCMGHKIQCEDPSYQREPSKLSRSLASSADGRYIFLPIS